MKYLRLILSFSFITIIKLVFCQCFFEIKILNKTTKIPVSFSSIRFLKEKSGYFTNKEGLVLINSTCIENDSLVISSVGYLTKYIRTSTLLNLNIIELEETNTTLSTILLITNKKLKSVVLNKFSGITYSSYHGNVLSPEIAQSFTSTYKSYKIKKVKIGKLKRSATFKLLLYNYDSITNKPTTIFLDTIIISDKKNYVTVDLSNLNIINTTNKIFVGIRWLFTDENVHYTKRNIDGIITEEKAFMPELFFKKNKEPDIETLFKHENDIWIKSIGGISSFLISVEIQRIL